MTLERLRAENHELRRENEQLRMAIVTRVLVERAKGVLIERLKVSAEDVSELLGLTARSSRRSLDEVVDEILETQVSPACVEGQIGHLRHRGSWVLKTGPARSNPKISACSPSETPAIAASALSADVSHAPMLAGYMPEVLKLTAADGTTEQLEGYRGRTDDEFEDLRNRSGRYESGWTIGKSDSEKWSGEHQHHCPRRDRPGVGSRQRARVT